MNFPRSVRAFTLIELLTVIAIIAVLMGLLFSAMSGVKNSAAKAQAKNDIMQTVTAVKSYYSEYQKYPMVDTKQGGATDSSFGGDGAAAPNRDVYNVLRSIAEGVNSNHVLNPRKIIFMEGKEAKNQDSPKGGFKSQANARDFYDPWGRTYILCIDGTYDGMTEVFTLTYTDGNFESGNKVRTGVIAASLGQDGTVGNKGDKKLAGSDDVVSWQ